MDTNEYYLVIVGHDEVCNMRLQGQRFPDAEHNILCTCIFARDQRDLNQRPTKIDIRRTLASKYGMRCIRNLPSWYINRYDKVGSQVERHKEC